MKTKESDAILRIAIREITDNEVKKCEVLAMPASYTPSDKLHNRILGLKHKLVRERIIKYISRTAAAILAILLLNTAIQFFTGTNIIASVVRYIRTSFVNDSVSYTIPKKLADQQNFGEINDLSLSFIPSGYNTTIDDCDEFSGLKVFSKNSDANKEFYVIYTKDPQKESNDLDTEHSNREDYLMNDGTKCDLWRCDVKGYYSNLVWSKGHYLFIVGFKDNLEGWEVDELIKISEGVRPIYKD